MLRNCIALILASIAIGCSEPNPNKQASSSDAAAQFNIDTSNVTVSGLSSGGYMASQYHIAFSKQVSGAALLASGPYGCAQGDLKTALVGCMNVTETIDIEQFYQIIVDNSKLQTIDEHTQIAGDRVWVFQGQSDQTVSRKVVDAQQQLYKKLGASVQQQYSLNAGHGFPTNNFGVECSQTNTPFINQCGVDLVSEFMTFISPLTATQQQAKSEVEGQSNNKLIEFDQSLFSDDNTLAEKGYLFVPADCFQGKQCRIHIAFHGCQQNVESIGMQFIKNTGVNQWAADNQMVVLYPQTTASYVPLNPKACWDWWGYTGADYLTKTGPQLKQINNMVSQLPQIINHQSSRVINLK